MTDTTFSNDYELTKEEKNMFFQLIISMISNEDPELFAELKTDKFKDFYDRYLESPKVRKGGKNGYTSPYLIKPNGYSVPLAVSLNENQTFHEGIYEPSEGYARFVKRNPAGYHEEHYTHPERDECIVVTPLFEIASNKIGYIQAVKKK